MSIYCYWGKLYCVNYHYYFIVLPYLKSRTTWPKNANSMTVSNTLFYRDILVCTKKVLRVTRLSHSDVCIWCRSNKGSNSLFSLFLCKLPYFLLKSRFLKQELSDFCYSWHILLIGIQTLCDSACVAAFVIEMYCSFCLNCCLRSHKLLIYALKKKKSWQHIPHGWKLHWQKGTVITSRPWLTDKKGTCSKTL